VSTVPEESVSLIVPELGGALGRVAATRPSREGPALDGIRITLATDLFVAAGEARDLAARGEIHSAVEALSQTVWASLWEQAVSAAGQEISDRILVEFQDAAVESRMPRAYLTRWTPTEPEIRAIRAHLGKGTRRLELALEELTAVANSVREGEPGDAPHLADWSKAVDLCARRVEAAWIELLEAADKERRRWSVEVDRVRQWRRPRWPMWLLTGVLVAAAVYLGLVAGGFVAPPDFLRPWAEFWWERL
jgi:hypothetical protein